MEKSIKEDVKKFWSNTPCGSGDISSLEVGSLEFFEAVEKIRFSGDDFMFDVVGFDQWKGKKVLEVGCGMGTDLLQFARGGAEVYGCDLTEKGATLTRKRLKLYGFQGEILVADGENLPFPNNFFDLVYSWGVIHHTPNTPAAMKEIIRICKPKGSILVMIYHRWSLLSLQMWIRYGLIRGKPWKSIDSIAALHLESPGTKIYSKKEALDLVDGLKDVKIRTIVTKYDLRLGRRLFLPKWFRKLVPSWLGWFLVIDGIKEGNEK